MILVVVVATIALLLAGTGLAILIHLIAYVLSRITRG